MGVRAAFYTGIIVLVGLQIVTAFGAIGLLGRMSPAIEQILDENVASNEAAEEMLAVLALGPEEGGTRERFAIELERARSNITEPGEVPVIDAIEDASGRLFDGDAIARRTVVGGLIDLVHINRAAMRQTQHEAQRLGVAGAWAAVVLALLGFAASVLVLRRATAAVLDPLAELEQTLDAFRQGNPFRRCRGTGASEEMRRVLDTVNELLDEAHRHGRAWPGGR